MKKFINRNYFWASIFVEQLLQFDIKYVCISPGSRNTPLTLAFANNKKVKKYIHVDERSSGFFALGVAKKINKPVVLVTTSGTAVAELYPAIIEAYNQRIPLIICTADRPAYLRNTGANQTINQDNIYKNHIRYFCDFGLPILNTSKLKSFSNKIVKGIIIGSELNNGPIHFNFPFKKPLEPEIFSDEINYRVADFIKQTKKVRKIISNNNEVKKIIEKIKSSESGIIFLGWGNYDNSFYEELIKFSQNSNFPIFTDGTSDLRFTSSDHKNIIVNHSAILQSLRLSPDLILQFGNAPTSKTALEFLNKTKADKFVLNKFGDLKDSSKRKAKVVNVEPSEFLKIAKLNDLNSTKRKSFIENIIVLDSKIENIKNLLLHKLPINIESKWVSELLKSIPPKSNLFISNSLPIRDFDLFASKENKNIKIFTNRGASGIDGIISTASGIADHSKVKTFLVIGDLAFYHNLTALSTLYEFKIPLIIILVNNNGGGIFKMLPVAKTKNHFEKYFNTPLNLDFGKIIKSFNGNYYIPQNWKAFQQILKEAQINKEFTVIELKTDTEKSVEFRAKYTHKVKQELSSKL